MRFNEDVTGFEQEDLLVSGAAATITEWDEVTAEREYTATITPTEEGTVTLTIAKGAAQGKRKQTLRDLKRSKSSMEIYLYSVQVEASLSKLDDPNGRATQTVKVDTTRPGVDITVPDTPQSGGFEVTVVFNEPVTDFVQSELTVSGAGASITTWTPVNGREQYTAEITPTEEGTVTLSVAENVAEDAAGNLNTASPSRTVEIDMTPPSVTITGVPTGVQNSAFDVTVTFSEDVTGFTASDIALTNSGGTDTVVATATVTGSGKTYTATITPTGGGTLGIQVPADAAVDAASNGNTVSAKHTVEVDTARPGVTITGAPSTTQNSAFDVTITFSEEITGFVAADIAFTNSGGTDTAAAAATLKADSDDATYTATITPTGTGSLSIQVPANAAVDAVNNGNTASDTHTVDVDTVAPTVTITGVPGTIQNSAFSITLTFSETVTGFTASDIALTGTDTADATATVTGTGTTYTATITPTGTGSLSIQVSADVVVDAGSNPNTASNTAQVQVDTTPPSVSIRVPEDVQDDAFEITVLFSEPVTGFSQAELAVTGVSATITNWAPQPDRARYVAQITPAEDIDGIVTFTIAENVAEDDAGNPNTVAPQQTVQVDSFIPPTIFGVEVTIQHTNPDSDPDINDLDSDGNHVDGPLVGAPMGNITATAYTPYRTSPVTDKVRFEVRRKDGTEWMAVETIDMESAVIVAQALPASVVQKWVATVAEGTPTVSIPDRYRKWMLKMDTTTLDDTITKDDAAGGRDVRIDENPYIIRAVAIAGGADHMGSGRVHDSFSMDNVDDVAPLERTIILTVSDHGGMLTASNEGVFTVGGIVDEAILAPMVMLTAKPRAHVKTFDHIKLVVNVRNANGTLGDTVDVGEVVFEHLEGYSYTVTLDVSDLANAEYGFQGLAVDKAMNVEKKVDSVATSTDVENYTPPPDSVTTVDWMDETEKDVAAITEAYPRGYLVTKSFTFTLVAAGIHPPEIDVMLGGSSTRDAGLLTVEQTNDGGGGLADPRTFVVTLDTSSTPDGKYMLTGVITKRNGSSDFGLPMLNIDSTGPMVEMISPKYGHELSPLPIRVTFTDGIGSGVVASSNTVMLELVRLMSGGESVNIPINQDEVDKPDGYIVEDNPNTPMVEASTGDLIYTSPDVLPGGAYELTVKVTDILGNTTNMGRGVTVDFTIVGTLLAVSIQSPISGQILDYKDPEIIVVYSGVGTEVTSFTLSNAADEAVAVNDPVMVSDPAQLDNNKMSYMPTEPLADGKYTAVVTVGDANGEVAKDAVTFTVSADDATPAVITQVSPQGVVKSDSATLSVQAYDEQSGVATVTLSLNGGDAAEGETLAVTGLVSGTQTVDAVVTNGAGLETTFRWTFTIVLDTTPPEISSVTPQGLVQTADVMLSAVVVDDQSAITSVTIAVDGGDATLVAEADIQAGTISQAVTGLESGTHSATIVAMSDGGSTSHIWTFTVMLDTTAPEISAVAPQGVVREANVMLSAVVVDEQSAITSVMIAVDGGAATPVAEADIQAGKIGQAVTGLESGTHTAEIVATSDGGSTTHSWTFTVMLDTTAPEISVVAPQGIVEQETTLISAVVVDEQSPVTSVTIAIDGGKPVDVPEADIQSGNISMELGDLKSGTYAVEVIATSSGGSRTHSWTFTVRLDTTPPEISSVAPQGLIRDDAVSISAVVVDEQSELESVTIALDDGAPIAVATVDIQNGRVGRDVLGLTTGTHTVTITATSAGGTTAHAWTFTVELDEKPPTITSTGPHGLVRKERPVVSVIATDDLSGVDTIEITLADSSGKKVRGETTQDRTSATFIPENAFTDDTQGTYVAKATVKDVRGNEASVKWAFTVEFDTIPPVITTATPQGEARITERKPLISAAYTDDISGIDTKSVKLWVDGKPVTPTKVTTSQVTYLPIADLNYGRRTVKLEVSDLATRKQNKTTHEWSFYVEAKTTRIVDARPIPNSFKDSTTITFTLSRQSRVTVELYDMSSRLVRTLVRGTMYDVGDASKIVWDGKTDTGEDLARGVYFCRIVLDSELTPESKVLKLALTR